MSKCKSFVNISQVKTFWTEFWLEDVTMWGSEAHSEEPCKAMIELKAVTYFDKKLHHVWQSSEYASDDNFF